MAYMGDIGGLKKLAKKAAHVVKATIVKPVQLAAKTAVEPVKATVNAVAPGVINTAAKPVAEIMQPPPPVAESMAETVMPVLQAGSTGGTVELAVAAKQADSTPGAVLKEAVKLSRARAPRHVPNKERAKVVKLSDRRREIASVAEQAKVVAPAISPESAAAVAPALKSGSSGGAAEIAAASSQTGADPTAILSAALSQANPVPSAFSAASSAVPASAETSSPAKSAEVSGAAKPLLIVAGLGALWLLFGRKGK